MVERTGKPLTVLLTAATCNDGRQLEAVLDAVAPIKRPLGRPRKRPDKLAADKAYDAQTCRAACRKRGLLPRIARRGSESSEKLGRHRWGVERTRAGLARFHRLRVRDERLAEIPLAFPSARGCAHLPELLAQPVLKGTVRVG